MNIIKNLLFKLIKKEIRKRLDNDSFKSMIVKAINKKIDIPKLSEAKEEKLFRAVIDAVCEFLKV